MMLPMLCTTWSRRQAVQALNAGMWLVEPKLDGVRALIHWDGKRARIMNRNNADMTHRWPEIVAWAQGNLPGAAPHIIDGEIVAKSGLFEDALKRDRQDKSSTIARMVNEIPVSFIGFDVVTDGATRVSYAVRRGSLELHAERSQLQIVPNSSDPDFIDLVESMGMEGVVLKSMTSHYQSERSQSWRKLKFTHRVTCLATSYTEGTGYRESTFGALELAMMSDTGLVSVGRVGAGFRDRELWEIKSMIDNGVTYLPVEVQCLGVSSNNILRQPTFKGIRVEAQLDNCLIDQLETVPHL